MISSLAGLMYTFLSDIYLSKLSAMPIEKQGDTLGDDNTLVAYLENVIDKE